MTTRVVKMIGAVAWMSLLAAACSPGAIEGAGSPALVSSAVATSTEVSAIPSARTLAATSPLTTATAAAAAAATSRGPELEATDPDHVRLASGGLQLVEFFRFT